MMMHIVYMNQRFTPLKDQQLSLTQAGQWDHKCKARDKMTGWGAESKRRTHKQSPTQQRKRAQAERRHSGA